MLKNETRIRESLEGLLKSIKASDIYKNYERASKEVQIRPGLQEQIDAYRRENYRIQQTYQGEELEQQVEAFEERTREFCSNFVVDEYLYAELEFIRLKQEMDEVILREVGFH